MSGHSLGHFCYKMGHVLYLVLINGQDGLFVGKKLINRTLMMDIPWTPSLVNL